MDDNAHTYPSRYPPGTNWAVDEAWAILDILRPGVLTLEHRALLAGLIAGTLVRVVADVRLGRDRAPQ